MVSPGTFLFEMPCNALKGKGHESENEIQHHEPYGRHELHGLQSFGRTLTEQHTYASAILTQQARHLASHTPQLNLKLA